jgi:hypothetical protein
MSVINLSNRNTTSKKTPEIDSLYAYSTRHKVKFTHHHQLGTGYKYTNHKAILKAGEDEIHIYHRTATIRGVTKGLTIVTKNPKFRDVQKFFNDQIKEIEKHDGLFEKFSHAKSTPIELGILYTY